jgi:eukaryotic-like serine/threonine-protein kinase
VPIKLTVTAGPSKGREFVFEGHDTFLVGRSRRAHFRLTGEDRYFSRLHFLIEANLPRCRLVDMGSRNGTSVNGQKVKTADLSDGDEIKAGHTVLRVSIPPEERERPRSFRGPLRLPPPEDRDLWREALRDDQRRRWEEGECPPVETYLAQVPALEKDGEALLDLIDAEFALRRARGQKPSPEEYAARFPEYATDLAWRLQSLSVVEAPPPTSTPPPPAPEAAPPQDSLFLAWPYIKGFTIERELGRGGTGVVYLARRESDGERVALKTITPAVAASPAAVSRFLHEAGALRRLRYRHIVSLLEVGESEGVLYFALEYVRGTDGARLLKRHGPLTVRLGVRILCQALRALAFAHAQGVVHRDVKPANLLLGEEDGKQVVKVADFGLARVYQGSPLSGLTLSGDSGGTVAYMAPEQITQFRKARPCSDQYAAAATLYHLLTGQLVYDFKSSAMQPLAVILQEDPVPILSRRPDLPEGLAEVIHRALSRSPEKRFPDADAFRRALLPYGE